MTKEIKNQTCPICDRTGNNVSIETGKDYAIYRCSHCHGDYAQTAQRMDYKAKIYEVGGDVVRDSYNKETMRSPEEHLSNPIRWYMHRLAAFLGTLPIKGKLLDVGCGVGTFAKMAEKVGFEVYAFDPAEEAIKYARGNFGLKKTIVGTIDDIPSDWQNFDVVSAIEVIEHVEAPRELVCKMYKLLKPGGYIIVSVPNRDRLGLKLWGKPDWDKPPHHLTGWSKQGLILFLADLDFADVRIRMDDLNRMSLSVFLPPKLNRKIAGDESSQDKKENNSFGSNLFWKCIQKTGDGVAFLLRNIAGDICNQYLANAVIAVAQKPK
jgi:SAM-dependent methyltransferase